MPFAKLGLTRPLLRGVQSMGYGDPTPIQLRAIPPATLTSYQRGFDQVAVVTAALKNGGYTLVLPAL